MTCREWLSALLTWIAEREGPEAGFFRQPRSPARFDGTPPGHLRCAPALGADTHAVLREIGFGEDEIEALFAAGARGAFSG